MRKIGAVIRQVFRFLFSREVIIYVFFGVLATLVNLGVYTLITAIFGQDQWLPAQLVAVPAAMLFAFFTNRTFVFHSHGPVLQEMGKFFSSRILVSLVFEIGAMWLMYDLIGFRSVLSIPLVREDISIAKLLTQVLVVVGNYVFSKLFIFTHRPPDKEHEPHEL